MSEYFGLKLREKRKERHMTQDQLAKKIGVKKQYISALERNKPHSTTGTSPQPRRGKVESLAKALDWDLNEARSAAFVEKNPVIVSDWEQAVKLACSGVEDLSDEEKLRIIDAIRLFVAGVRAERLIKPYRK